MLRLLLLSLLTALLASSCGSLIPHASEALPSFTHSANNKALWWRRMGDPASYRPPALEPYLAQKTAYTIQAQGRLAAYLISNGRQLWAHDLKRAITAGISGDEKHLYLAARDGLVLAYAQQDGALLWQWQAAGEIVSLPLIMSDERLLIQTTNGHLQMLARQDGRLLWQYSETTSGFLALPNIAPLYSSGMILAAMADGSLLALDSDGKLLWQRQVFTAHGATDLANLNAIVAALPLDDNRLLLASFHGELQLLHLQDNRTLWRRQLNPAVGLLHAAQTGHVYMTDAQGHISALNSDNGEVLWQQAMLAERGLSPPIWQLGYLAIADQRGWLHWFDQQGKPVTRRHIGHRGIWSRPRSDGDIILLQSGDAHLFAYRLLPPAS